MYGKDVRKELKYPSFHELYADVKRHYETIRKYAQSTGRSFYSFGWIKQIHLINGMNVNRNIDYFAMLTRCFLLTDMEDALYYKLARFINILNP